MQEINERESIILGALLHDIGKFMQKGNVPLTKSPQNMEVSICPVYHNDYSHKHVLWTDEFFESYIPKVFYSAANFARYHHKPNDELQKIVTIADRLSAGLDRNIEKKDDEVEGKDKYKKMRLKPIFEDITLKFEKTDEKYKYELNPLILDEEVISPKIINKLNPSEGEDLTNVYKKLWDEFISEFNELPQHNFNIFFNSLFYLLQKYTWCIASSTVDYPDISLFDHLKTTTAIATCLYDYQKSEKESNKEFLLLAGDISGIQNFIYKITQAEGAPGTSKRLRGRSFYLSIFTETVSKKIITELSLTIANIIYCGGGRFEILLPNTKHVNQKLLEIKKQVDCWLIKNFEGELGLITEMLELDCDELKRYGEFISVLDDKVSTEKKRKYYNLLFEEPKNFTIPIEKDFFGNDKEILKNKKITICKSCDITLIPKENDICEYCEEHRKIGEFLPESKAIVFSKDNLYFSENNAYLIDFEQLGKVYLVSNLDSLKNILNNENIIEIKLINTTETRYGGFGFIANIVPTAKEDFSINIQSEEHYFKKGDVLDFETIASLSTGDQRLGLLRMDVDYLGLIFAIGLEPEHEDTEYNPKSISRISTLSRMLDLFFAGFLNNICNEVFKEWYEETKNEIKDKITQIFYISYSGGDDLLIIGPWSEIPKLAYRIREKFKKFTCNNKNIDVSAGILLIKPKFPIGRAAVVCGEKLEKSKDKGRSRITLFDETVKWDKDNEDIDFLELFEFGENLYYAIITETQDDKLPRGFVHSLIRKRNKYIKDDKIDLNYISSLIYQITRNIKEKAKIKIKEGEEIKLKEYLYQKLITEPDGQKIFSKVKIPASYALLKSRKEG